MVSLKEFLKSKLTKRELSELHSSFDIIGNRDKAVAIVQIPEKLEKKKKFVAQGIMKLHPNVKSVLQKLSGREEEYRLNQFKLIGGDKNTEVVHKEFGLRLKLDPQKVYFSPRESTERLRVTNQVKRGETVMVFFAGAGPYVCLIGRKTRASRIIGIEINARELSRA